MPSLKILWYSQINTASALGLLSYHFLIDVILHTVGFRRVIKIIYMNIVP